MSQSLFEKFLRILQKLDQEQVDYVLIGGVAVILYGFERPTRDIDLFIRLVPENISRLRKVLFELYDDDSINEITVDELQNYSVVRYGTPDGFYIDIIANIGEVFSYQELEYETVNYNSVQIKIATPETLLKLKNNTLREKDQLDLYFLKDLIQRQKK